MDINIESSLRRIPCLSLLSEKELWRFSEKSHILKFKRSQILFQEDEIMRFFFVVKDGKIKLFKTSKDGKTFLIKLMNPGEYFCCATLLSGGRATVSAMAIDDSSVVAIPSEEFKKILFEHIGDTGRMIISGLCTKIRYLSRLLEDMTFKDVEERVLFILLRIAKEDFPDSKIVTFRLTHQEIAEMTGTVREVVSRTMARLKKDGIIIDSTSRGFTVDIDRLLKCL